MIHLSRKYVNPG